MLNALLFQMWARLTGVMETRVHTLLTCSRGLYNTVTVLHWKVMDKHPHTHISVCIMYMEDMKNVRELEI